MTGILAGSEAGSVASYEHHHPAQSLLYRIVEQHHPAFLALMAVQGRALIPRLSHRPAGARVENKGA